MKNVEKNMKYLKRRKLLLLLPLLFIPFLTLTFWALGGGNSGGENKAGVGGLNIHLPEAQMGKDKDESKFRLYENAEKDSLHRKKSVPEDISFDLSSPSFTDSLTPSYDPYSSLASIQDPNEQKVYQKLAELDDRVKSAQVEKQKPALKEKIESKKDLDEGDLKKFVLLKKENKDDPELAQLNDLMDKVLDIQHPERVKNRSTQKEYEGQTVLSVQKKEALATVSSLGFERSTKQENGFLSVKGQTDAYSGNTIEALVHGDHHIQNDGLVKLRLLSDVSVKGTIIPKDIFLFGQASQNGERLNITISSIKDGKAIYPVRLEVYDMDGLPGLYVPNSGSREVAKSSINNASQMLRITSLDPSLKGKAADAGLHAVKTMLRKKTGTVKFFVKGGHKVFLRDQNLKH